MPQKPHIGVVLLLFLLQLALVQEYLTVCTRTHMKSSSSMSDRATQNTEASQREACTCGRTDTAGNERRVVRPLSDQRALDLRMAISSKALRLISDVGNTTCTDRN